MFTYFKIWWLQLRFGLESGAYVSRDLNGALGSVKIRGAEWKDAKQQSGYFGQTAGEARLNALRFWVYEHVQQKPIWIESSTQPAIEARNTNKIASGESEYQRLGQVCSLPELPKKRK